MEWTWGTFFTVLLTGYLFYYGVIFLFDLVTKGRTAKVEAEGVEYSMGELVDEEEESAQVVDRKAFAEPTVKTHNTPAPPAQPAPPQASSATGDTDQDEVEPPQEDAAGDTNQDEVEPPQASSAGDTDQDEVEPPQASSAAGDTDQKEVELPQEDSVKMAVVGEPMQPTNYLKMLREQAQKSALSQSRAIFG